MKIDAEQVIQQLGGFRRLQSMINAQHFSKAEDYVTFKFTGSKVANYLKVTLLPSDTYKVVFIKLWGSKVKVVKEVENVYADSLIELFENTTGLYLRI